MPLARISLTLSCHFPLALIASGRSLGLHPLSSQSCSVCVLAGHPALDRPYVGVHRSTSLMSSSLLLHKCPACLVRLTSRMLRAILNKTWRKHPTKHQLYGHLPSNLVIPIEKNQKTHNWLVKRKKPPLGLLSYNVKSAQYYVEQNSNDNYWVRN